ncbi:MAG: hypothetical protein V7724_13185 [Sediminicola sp.]
MCKKRICLFVRPTAIEGHPMIMAGIFIWLFTVNPDVRAQRVYADTDQITSTLLAGVTNRANALTSNPATYSEVYANLSLAGLTSAAQNLRFTGANGNPVPRSSSPIMVRFGNSASLVGILDNIAFQRTNGGINNTVGTAYTSSTLANLLTLFSTPGATEAIVPIPNNSSLPSDGIRLRVSSVLGLSVRARYYHAFFIVPPVPGNSEIAVCEGDQVPITISNFYPGYVYRAYNTLTGGTQIGGDNTTASFSYATAQIPASGNLWIEAAEVNGQFRYPSARTPITVTISPKPGPPSLQLSGD